MEISHVELVTKTILRLLDGAPEYPGKKFETPGKCGKATMDMVKEQQNPHHFIMGAQSALLVDAAGNPWSGSYVHNPGAGSNWAYSKKSYLPNVIQQDTTIPRSEKVAR